ncbi:hypothetical protein GQ457_04G012650 [Hibiscus cannabinus]
MNPSDFGPAPTAADVLEGHGGRPPDPVLPFDGSVALERPRSPLVTEIQPCSKKGRCMEDSNQAGISTTADPEGDMDMLLEYVNTDSIERVESILPTKTSNENVSLGSERGSTPVAPSFKDKLVGSDGGFRAPASLSDLDVEVLDDDIRIGGTSTLPEIQFSERVHDAIDSKLEKSVIIRLLGRTIGYHTLLNRIQLLWKPKGEFSLIDLDNNYFLVRFAIEEDFRHVLLDGPWVIFGSCLTVQPWSRYFSTKEEYPSQVMVWVRLPKLPYRYYTKSLFRHIAASIGTVVRIDYNTTEGKQGRFARLAIVVDLQKPLVSGIIIDGQRQDIEYEGLPEICFKCGKYGHLKDVCGVTPVAGPNDVRVGTSRDSNELYGPWMQVADRRRRVRQQVKDVINRDGGVSGPAAHRSRFAVLADVPEDNGIESEQGIHEDPVGVTIQNSSRVQQSDIVNPARQHAIEGSTSPVRNCEANVENASVPTVVSATARRVASPPGLDGVASSGKVVMAKSILRADKNVAIRVLEPGFKPVSKEVRGRVLPNSLKGGSSRHNLKLQGANLSIKQPGIKPKKRDERAVGKYSLASGLSNLLSDLDKAEAIELAKQNSIPPSAANVDNRVSWIQNSTFEPPDGGALDPNLHKSFKLLVKKQVPDIAVVMEPRISGREADVFIRKMGFDFSFRVEARGFSGGIWIMWRDSVRLDMLAVSNQYIHGLCSTVDDGKNFFVTFVYASPDPVRRRSLWDQLKSLVPDNNTPWVIGGDLNVISSSVERQGGSPYRLNVCRDFGDFLLDTGLLDMGFQGPRFTWKRGMLSQRLDRCLCNSDWYGLFPLSEVYHLIKLGSDHRPILLDTSPCVSSSGERPFRYIAAWNAHPKFDEFLRHVWLDSADLATNVSSFREESRSWNREVFGHIGRRKNLLLARIKGVEMALEASCNPFLENLEGGLKRELLMVLDQEESLWYQKARAQWIEKGDRNTTFFHTAATMRRKRNSIRMLRLDDGSWCADHTWLKEHAIGFFQQLFTSAHSNEQVWDLTNMTMVSGNWDWSRLSPVLPQHILDQIAAVPLPQSCYGSDTVGWRWCDNRCFSSRSAYAYLMDSDAPPTDTIWKYIWSLKVPQRVRTFLWVTIHQRHLTNAERFRRHLGNSAICTICDLADEDLDHILRRCLPALFCWLLWKDRCTSIFDSDNAPTEDILTRGLRLAAEYSSGCAKATGQISLDTMLQSWSRPPLGWVKVNADASVNLADGKAAIGCVIRDENGNWIQGFARNVGRCSVLLAELWAVHDSLVQAWYLDFRRVIIETDCLEVIRILTRSSRALVGNNLVESILLWTRKEWQLVVRHVSRHENSLADRLAALGRSASCNGLSLLIPPADLVILVEEEKARSACGLMPSEDWATIPNVACFNLHVDLGG